MKKSKVFLAICPLKLPVAGTNTPKASRIGYQLSVATKSDDSACIVKNIRKGVATIVVLNHTFKTSGFAFFAKNCTLVK